MLSVKSVRFISTIKCVLSDENGRFDDAKVNGRYNAFFV